jgi:steroid delta-isomerase
MSVPDELVSRYQAFFENMTDESVEDYREFATPDVRYLEPHADARGIDEVIEYMHRVFSKLDETDFRLEDSSMDGLVGFQDWVMRFRIRKSPKKLWEIRGVSKVTCNEDGKVVEHIDFWDPSPIYESVPILGRVVTLIKRLAF